MNALVHADGSVNQRQEVPQAQTNEKWYCKQVQNSSLTLGKRGHSASQPAALTRDQDKPGETKQIHAEEHWSRRLSHIHRDEFLRLRAGSSARSCRASGCAGIVGVDCDVVEISLSLRCVG